jgi:predicted ATPase
LQVGHFEWTNADAAETPLFIEELTRAVVQADWHDVAPVMSASVSKLPDHTVPAALYAPLAARIDRLHGVREVVQAAAVIGREFTLELLAGVTRLSEQPLLDALAKLSEARLMCRSSSALTESYAFNHMLIRDVAYSMLLRDRRRQLHQRVAEVLRGRCMEQGDAAPELLAHHCALAGLIEPGGSILVTCRPARRWLDFRSDAQIRLRFDSANTRGGHLPKNAARRIEIDQASMTAALGSAPCSLAMGALSP